MENIPNVLSKSIYSNMDGKAKDFDNISTDSKLTFIYSNWIEFYLILIGYVIGFGSFWRFPYLVFTNGGGIFVLVFAILLIFIGIPVFYLETYLGQIFRHGPVEVFIHIHKKFTGVGWAMVLTTWMLSLYYAIILVWAYYYLFASFSIDLPWSNSGKVDESGNPLPGINTVGF